MIDLTQILHLYIRLMEKAIKIGVGEIMEEFS